MTRFLHRFRWHILFWIAYFIGFTWLSVSVYHTPFWRALGITLAWFLGQSTMIYLTVYNWMPLLLKPKRIGLFILAILGSILGGALLTAALVAPLLHNPGSSFTIPFDTFFGYALSGNLYWEFIAIGLTIFRDRLRNDRRNQRLEKEQMENELRFLKSQMNPHFLFNAINSIYVLIRKDPSLAEHTLASFSDMLRYQLYDCSTDFIPIEKEITYLENYMRLEQLRKGPMLSLEYTTEGTVRDFSIAPLLLMPLVENAFKFVSSFTELTNNIRIRLTYSDSFFIFEIGNTIDEFVHLAQGPTPDGSATGIRNSNGAIKNPNSAIRNPNSGIGLDNVRRRLELLYPLQHTLTIDPGETYYTVALKLKVA
jgi:LytS/YehU family sensor histidine kinase